MQWLGGTGEFILCAALCKKTSGQEGRSAHASTRAKTRLGVRQNTGPLPLAASVRYTAGAPLLLLLCRNRIQDSGEAAGINALAAVTTSLPPPSLSVLSYSHPVLVCGRYTQMLMLSYLSQGGPKQLRGWVSVWACQDGGTFVLLCRQQPHSSNSSYKCSYMLTSHHIYIILLNCWVSS